MPIGIIVMFYPGLFPVVGDGHIAMSANDPDVGRHCPDDGTTGVAANGVVGVVGIIAVLHGHAASRLEKPPAIRILVPPEPLVDFMFIAVIHLRMPVALRIRPWSVSYVWLGDDVTLIVGNNRVTVIRALPTVRNRFGGPQNHAENRSQDQEEARETEGAPPEAAVQSGHSSFLGGGIVDEGRTRVKP
jgi:hypothetical protein